MVVNDRRRWVAEDLPEAPVERESFLGRVRNFMTSEVGDVSFHDYSLGAVDDTRRPRYEAWLDGALYTTLLAGAAGIFYCAKNPEVVDSILSKF